MNETIHLEDVRKWYGSVRAVDGLTMDVGPGRVVGFLGLNGAGKTTTIRLLAGLIRAERGTLSILGEDPWSMRPETRRRIGYLSEKDFPFREMTFDFAVAFTSRFHPSWDGAYVAKLAGMLEVPGNLPYGMLSRGQQRKFQLALTLASRPEVVLLDDPAQGLDVAVRRQFIDGILPLLQEGQSTVLFSSHIMSDVERIADTIAVLDRGRLVLQDSLDRLKERARRVVVSGAGRAPLEGALCVRRSGAETCFTVLDADLKAIEELRKGGAVVDVQPVGLEDLFLDVIDGARAGGQS